MAAIINPCPSTTLNGIGVQCADNIGGISRVFIAKYEDVTTTVEQGVITAITIAESKDKFKEYNFRKATGGMTSTATINDQNGTIYYSTVLSLQFNGTQATKQAEINTLVRSNLAVIVEDRRGKYWYLGKDSEVTSTAATMAAGTAYEDLNGYTLELTDVSKEMPYEVDATLITNTIIDFN